jgi:uncharacterized protein
MKRFMISSLIRLVVRHPVALAIVFALCAAFSAWRMSLLQINYNQIELIPQSLPSVVATKNLINKVGGVGFLQLALKGDNLEQLKGVVEDLNDELSKLPEIRKITYKQDISFVRDRIALYIKTADLQEGYDRIRKKIRSVIRKQSPLGLELREIEDKPLDLSDLVDKYVSVNKKAITDPFYIDHEKKMILMLIKPRGDATDLAFTRNLLVKIENIIKNYSEHNSRNAKLAEYYQGMAPGASITYGYTGTYKTNLDDSDNMRAALVPTSAVAFAGIFLYLLIYLRRISQIAVIMTMLTIGVVMTYAFCELSVGSLNTITAILGGILMGVGIDYGIQFISRFREEYTFNRDLLKAIEAVIEHTGAASVTSALTTAAGLYILGFSKFKGFSDFGMVMGTGVILTAIAMYIGVPLVYILFDRFWPSFKNNLIQHNVTATREEIAKRHFPYAKGIVIGSTILTMVLAFFATRVKFDYDSRSFVSADRPSIVLQDEIRQRFDISADPVGFYTATLEDTRALYDALVTKSKIQGSLIDQIASVYTLVPEPEQQLANRTILDKLKEQLSQIPEDLLLEGLSAAQKDKFHQYKYLIDAKPFTLSDLPSEIITQFQPIPESNSNGYLTYVYPTVALWDSKALLSFANEIGSVTTPSQTYQAAGSAVLYADLARIVLHDGKFLSLCVAILVFAIVYINYRSLAATVFCMLPLMAGMLWMLGLMALADWRLNFMNIVVFPVVFGYGISGGTYLYYRFLESRSAYFALRQTGAAVAASSTTTFIGWASLFASSHRGLISMGILACFGIASALLVSMTLLPALIEIFSKHLLKQKTPASGI